MMHPSHLPPHTAGSVSHISGATASVLSDRVTLQEKLIASLNDRGTPLSNRSTPMNNGSATLIDRGATLIDRGTTLDDRCASNDRCTTNDRNAVPNDWSTALNERGAVDRGVASDRGLTARVPERKNIGPPPGYSSKHSSRHSSHGGSPIQSALSTHMFNDAG